MQDLDEKSNEKKPSRITRRKFVGAVGAAAALGTIALERRLDASPSEVYYYQTHLGTLLPSTRHFLTWECTLRPFPPRRPFRPMPPTLARCQKQTPPLRARVILITISC